MTGFARKRVLWSVATALLAWHANAATKVISFTDITDKDTVVIGAVGVPLGTVFQVEGTIVPARETLGLLYNSRFMLKVEKVNGTPLPKPVRMWFRAMPNAGTMPDEIFALAEWKTGHPCSELAAGEQKKLEAEYVGTRYKVLVVENGRFAGVPEELPDGCPLWSAPAYGFETDLLVLAGGQVK